MKPRTHFVKLTIVLVERQGAHPLQKHARNLAKKEMPLLLKSIIIPENTIPNGLQFTAPCKPWGETIMLQTLLSQIKREAR